MTADASEQRVTCNGLSFRTRLDGPAGAPWMLLGNSLLTDLTLWDAQVAAFAGRYRILRYDQRGHGGTEVPDAPVTLDLLVDDAASLLDAFAVERAVLGGVSMGAATMLCLAARQPDRVSRVIASDGQAKTAPDGARAWQDRIDVARRDGMAAVVEATVARWFRPDFVAADGADLRRARTMMLATPLDGYAACAAALKAYDFEAALATLEHPVLLVAGAADGAMPATMRRLQSMLPDARFVEIADAGHLPNLERPEAFNAAMASFLDSGLDRGI